MRRHHDITKYYHNRRESYPRERIVFYKWKMVARDGIYLGG